MGKIKKEFPVVDTTALVYDPVDSTKTMRIDVEYVATGTERVVTMPDRNINLDNVPESARFYVALKTADETVNNSTVMQNDDELLLPLKANKTYEFNCRLLYNTNATADIKIGWAVPTGTTMAWSVTSGTAVDVLTESQVAVFEGLGADKFANDISGIVIVGANAGNLQLQWAQNTADASDTKILKNSIIKMNG